MMKFPAPIKKMVAVYFIAVVMCFMISIVLRFFIQDVLIKQLTAVKSELGTAGTAAGQADTDWMKLFPFENASDADDVFKKTRQIEETWPGYIKSGIENYISHRLIYRSKFKNIAERYEKIIGWVPHFFYVVDLGDTWTSPSMDKSDPKPPVDALVHFAGFLETLDLNLLYVQCPDKVSKYDAINNTKHFSNQRTDDFLSKLSSRGITYIDMREHIYNENLNYHSLFFKTDGHWKLETGLWAAGIIAEHLNRNNGFDIGADIFNPDRYLYEAYQFESYMYDYNKRLGLENANLMYPLFDTDFTLRIPSRNIDVQGTFDVFYDYEYADKEENLLYYYAFLYTNSSLVRIRNHLSRDGKKVLMIRDSFCSVVAPFLALGVENIELLDVRFFAGSVETYIKQNLPDMVIVMYAPGNIFDPDAGLPPQRSPFDFR